MALINLSSGQSYIIAKENNTPLIVEASDFAGDELLVNNNLFISSSNGNGRLKTITEDASNQFILNANDHAYEVLELKNMHSGDEADTRLQFTNTKNTDYWSIGLGADHNDEFLINNATSFGDTPLFSLKDDGLTLGYKDGQTCHLTIYGQDSTERNRLKLYIDDTNGAVIQATYNTGGMRRLTLKSATHEAVRIDQDHGIRFNTIASSITSDPSHPFHVYCDRDSDWQYVAQIQNDDSNTKIKLLSFYDNNSEVGYIQSNGAYYGNGTFAASDGRLKKNVINLGDDILEKLCRLRPVSFNWNEKTKKDSSITHIGHIAQEVEKIFPGVVSSRDNTDNGGYSDHRDINNAALVPHLVKAIQVLEARVKELENK